LGGGCAGSYSLSCLIGALDDEKYFFLVEMDVVGRPFTRFQPPHENRDNAAGGLGGEEYFQVEAERLDRQPVRA
jgi:hypothetical protein